LHFVTLEDRISENRGIIQDIHCEKLESAHIVIMKKNLHGMSANLLEESRRDCESSIISIDSSCNRKWMRILNCNMSLVTLGVLEGRDPHRLHEIQMDADRWIIVRCEVLWRAIVHCDICFMCRNFVIITESECDSCDPHA
jgi:hypothetical protein